MKYPQKEVVATFSYSHHSPGPELVHKRSEICGSKHAQMVLTNSNKLQPIDRAAARTEYTRHLQALLPPTKGLHCRVAPSKANRSLEKVHGCVRNWHQVVPICYGLHIAP